MMGPGRRRAVRLGLWGLGALVGAYLIGVNLLLNTPLGPLLVNLRPRSAHLDWRSAWTFFPGHLTVRGLDIEGQARSRAWSVTIERASGRWSPLALLARRLDWTEVRADGVATRIRRAPSTSPEARRTEKPGSISRTRSSTSSTP